MAVDESLKKLDKIFDQNVEITGTLTVGGSEIDFSSYITTETDPIFSASAAAGITLTNITNWNAAYGWGNHADAGYLTSLPSHNHDGVYQPLNTTLSRFSESNWAGGGSYPGYTFSGGNTRFGLSSTAGVVDLYIDGNFYATDSSHLVIHAGNIGSQSVAYSASSGYAANAGLLDGLDSSAFMRDDGWNTYPGQDANTQTGMRSDFSYSNNAPHTGDLIRFGASQYSLQLSSQYNGSGQGFSFRTRNGDVSSWNPWYQIIHAGNIGSQSVSYASNAGTLDSLDSTEFARGKAAWQQLNFDSFKQPGLYQYDSIAAGGGTAPPDSSPYNFRTIEIGSANRYSQIALGYNTDSMYFRRNLDGNWSAWRTVIHDGNIGSYAAGLNGSYNNDWYANSVYYDDWLRNHSNTNGLYWSTTGWHLHPYNSNDFTLRSGSSVESTIRFANSGNTTWGYIHCDANKTTGFLNDSRNWVSYTTTAGNHYATGSSRAPIFYDTNNTGYYLDPNGTSNLNGLNVGGYSVNTDNFRSRYRRGFYIAGTADKFYKVKISIDQVDRLRIYRYHASTIGGSSSYWNGGSTTHFGALNFVVDTLRNDWGGHRSMMSGYLQHNYTVVMGRARIGQGSEHGYAIVYLRGGAGGSGAFYRVETESIHSPEPIIDYNDYITTADDEFNDPYLNREVNTHGTIPYIHYAAHSYRAPIFYDSNNTGYFVDPASGSNINQVRMVGHLSIGSHGDSSPSTVSTSARITFGSLSSDAIGNYSIGTTLENYGGNYNKLDLAFHTGIRLGAHPNYGGVRFFSDQTMTTEIASIGKSGNYIDAVNSVRAPIFYDSNNTGYYVNPDSTSVLYDLSIGNGSSGNQKIEIRYGNSSSGYGAIRFFQSGSNNQTIHAFSTSWQGGLFPSQSAGAINITGANGVTFGGWNNPDAWIDTSGNISARVAMFANTYYDRNNTNYYLNPDGGSNINTLDTGDTLINHTRGGRIGFTASGNASDGFPYARIGEAWGVSFYTPDPRWAPNVSNASFLVGFTSGGSNHGVGNIKASGDIIAYASDKRLKRNIKPITNALNKVINMNGVYYDWDLELCKKFDFHPSEKTEAGVLAQEVQEVFPEVVQQAPFDYAADENGNLISKSGENYLTVKYEKLVPLLIEAVKELSNKVEDLENQLKQKS